MAKRITVVGAGIVGASIAWHLARQGCHVTIVDAGEGGGVATPHSFAWINATWGNPEAYFHFRRRSMARWRELQREIPEIGVDFCGSILWDLPPAELADYEKRHRSWGYDLRRVGRDEIARIEPNLLDPPDEALACAEEGAVEPVAAAMAFLNRVSALGGSVRTATRVETLHVDGGRVTGLKTADDIKIDSDDVVLAAGVETSRLLETVGVALKTTAPPGLIAHSTISGTRLLNGMIMSPDCHIRQTAEGRLIVGADFAGADPEDDPEGIGKRLLESAKAMIRGAGNLELAFNTIGHRPTPADGVPAIGRPRGIDGLYVATMHSGVTLAPIVGQLVARDIAHGDRDPDLRAYDPGRPSLAS